MCVVVLVAALTPGIIKHDCLRKLSEQYAKIKDRSVKDSE